jgi:hypothetical protein
MLPSRPVSIWGVGAERTVALRAARVKVTNEVVFMVTRCG